MTTAYWLYENGIGEERAALVDGGAIVEALIEPAATGPQPGAIVTARLTQLLPRGGGIAVTADRAELLVDRVGPATQGATLTLEVVRSALPEPGKVKRAKARLSEALPATAPGLRDRLAATGYPVRELAAPNDDLLDAAGWGELLEEAAGGEIGFPGGALRISLTPAMTLIDVDGTLDPDLLALAGSTAAARAIRRLGLGGSIGLDLPATSHKGARLAAAQALDAHLPPPFERTAVNGFGFLQLVRPRARPSLPELVQYQPAASQARALLRRAERSGLFGATALVAHPRIIARLAAHPAWLATLGARLGGPVGLREDERLAISSGYAVKA